MMDPDARSVRQSNLAMVVHDGWWIVATTTLRRPKDAALPPSTSPPAFAQLRPLATPLSTSTMLSVSELSRPDVGSSQHKMLPASSTSSMPMEHRFRWPPEMPTPSPNSPTIVSAQPSSPRSRSSAFTRPSMSLTPFKAAANVRIMRGDSVVGMMSSCGTSAHARRRSVTVIAAAPKPTLPWTHSSARSPMRHVSSVVLPAPEPPMMALRHPRRHVAQMFLRIVTPDARTVTSSATRSPTSSPPRASSGAFSAMARIGSPGCHTQLG